MLLSWFAVRFSIHYSKEIWTARWVIAVFIAPWDYNFNFNPILKQSIFLLYTENDLQLVRVDLPLALMILHKLFHDSPRTSTVEQEHVSEFGNTVDTPICAGRFTSSFTTFFVFVLSAESFKS